MSSASSLTSSIASGILPTPVIEREVKIYEDFRYQAEKLDSQLQRFHYRARKLGGSAGIQSSSSRLQEHLDEILRLYQENAVSLYPRHIAARIGRKPVHLQPIEHRKQVLTGEMRTANTARTHRRVLFMNLGHALSHFSKDIEDLLRCFNEFPELMAELPDLSQTRTAKALADCFEAYDVELLDWDGAHFMEDAMGDLKKVMTFFEGCFERLAYKGLSAVKATQAHDVSNLENQTLVATLFAGIATAILQIYTGASSEAFSDTALVILLYMCLIFSLGSVVNGLLALSWIRATYEIPRRIRSWIRIFPLILLIAAVICSFLAIIQIAHLPSQSRTALFIITTMSALSFLSLIAIPGWLTLRTLLLFFHRQGKGQLVNKAKLRDIKHWVYILPKLNPWLKGDGDLERNEVEGTSGERQPLDEIRKDLMVHLQNNRPFWSGQNRASMEPNQIVAYRWHEAVRRIIRERRIRVGLSPLKTGPHDRFSHLTKLKLDRHNTVRKLQNLSIVSKSPGWRHPGVLPHLQFSPNGKYLLTSDVTPLYLYRVDSYILSGPVLELNVENGTQMIWSSDSSKILGRTRRRLTVWRILENKTNGGCVAAQIGEYISPSSLYGDIEAAAWSSDEDAIFFVQDKRLMIMKNPQSTGSVRTAWGHSSILKESELSLRHIAICRLYPVADSHWIMFLVKYVKDEDDGTSLKKSGLIIWDLVNRKVIRETQVYRMIRDVALSLDNRLLLISYEDGSPSQCWALYTQNHEIRLAPQQSYVAETELAVLPSIFGGEEDHLVLRASSAGDVYVWDRDSGELVHCIKASRAMLGGEVTALLGGEVTALSWNKGSESYMFATGTLDGNILIWRERLGEDAPNEDPGRIQAAY